MLTIYLVGPMDLGAWSYFHCSINDAPLVFFMEYALVLVGRGIFLPILSFRELKF